MISLLCVFAFVLLSSCNEDNEDNDNPVNPVTEKGTLLLHMHNYIDDIDIGELIGIPNTDNNGRSITINLADLYISEIEMVKLDGSVYRFSGKRVLKVFENVLYEIGEIPVGNYNTIRFNVGLDSATNASSPLNSPDSVILNRPNMWFGSTAQPDGYVFLNIQGMIDTSAAHNQSAVPFTYNIGTNSNYHQVIVNGINLSIVKNQASTAHLVADYNVLFNGITLNDQSNLSITTPAENNSPLASAIVSNMLQMFKTE